MTLYAGLYGPQIVEYPNGAHAPGIPIEVRRAADLTLATLYSDKDRSVTVANPTLTDSLGNLYFWAEPDEYFIESSADGPLRIVVGLHPAEPVGAGSGDFTTYVHTQSVPLATWIVNHGLGRKTHCTIFDPLGIEVEADVQAGTINQTTIMFPAPDTGSVVIS